jgi:hypothetical protein
MTTVFTVVPYYAGSMNIHGLHLCPRIFYFQYYNNRKTGVLLDAPLFFLLYLQDRDSVFF